MAGLSPKDIRVLLEHLRGQGVRMARKKNGWMLYLPNGETAMVHMTPSDSKGWLPLRAQVTRAGLTWPTDKQLREVKFDGVELPDYITKGRAPGPAILAMVQKGLDKLDKDGVTPFTPKQVILAAGRSTADYLTIYRALIHLNYRPVLSKTGLTKKWEKIPEIDAELDAVIEPDEQPGEFPEVQKARGAAVAPVVAPVAAPVKSAVLDERIVLDSAESWTVELRSTALGDLTVRQLRQVLAATGMNMEIRVWRGTSPLEMLNGVGAPEQEKIKNGEASSQ